MIKSEMIECRDNLLDCIEALRKHKPEIWFDVAVIPLSEDDYHVHITGKVKYMLWGSEKVREYSDLFTKSWGKAMSMHRVMAVAKKLKVKNLTDIELGYLNGLE